MPCEPVWGEQRRVTHRQRVERRPAQLERVDPPWSAERGRITIVEAPCSAEREAAEMEQRVSLITLGVRDVGVSRQFYEALGWSGQSPDGEVVFFQTGGMVVALWSRELLAEDSCVRDTGGWGGTTLAHNVRAPQEVDAVLAEAEAAGATIGRPAAATPWGGYSGVFLDPDGHPWEVAHNPGWRIDEHGAVHL